jgi:hypothetical protein
MSAVPSLGEVYVIREAGEGSRKAKSIFCGLEKHLGEDTALTAVHWMALAAPGQGTALGVVVDVKGAPVPG